MAASQLAVGNVNIGVSVIELRMIETDRTLCLTLLFSSFNNCLLAVVARTSNEHSERISVQCCLLTDQALKHSTNCAAAVIIVPNLLSAATDQSKLRLLHKYLIV